MERFDGNPWLQIRLRPEILRAIAIEANALQSPDGSPVKPVQLARRWILQGLKRQQAARRRREEAGHKEETVGA
jgi:hypothetical protein